MSGIYVIGGANVDISARSFNKIIPADSNPGKVSYSVGGVGHNIAANLGRSGCDVNYITALSTDSFSQMIEASCYFEHLNLDLCQKFEQYSSSVYVAMVDYNGDMNVAVSDMDILSHLDVSKLYGVLNSLKEDDILVMETNLTESQIADIISNTKAAIYVDPISTTKADKMVPHLNRLEMLKPNHIEAIHLSGLPLENKDDYRKMLDYFLDKGVKEIVISMGAKGVIGSNGQQYYHLNNIKTDIVNTTGAGDGFMAGYVYGKYHEHDFLACLKYALANAAIALASLETVNPHLTNELLETMAKRVEQECVVELL